MNHYKRHIRRAGALMAAAMLMTTGTGCNSSRQQLRAIAEQQAEESRQLATTAVRRTARIEEEELRAEPIAGDTAELRLSEAALLTLPDGAEYRVRGKRTEVSLRREGTTLTVRATADSVARQRAWRRIRDQTETTTRADSASYGTSRQRAEQSEERRSRNWRSWLAIAAGAAAGGFLALEWLRERKRRKENQ